MKLVLSQPLQVGGVDEFETADEAEEPYVGGEYTVCGNVNVDKLSVSR